MPLDTTPRLDDPDAVFAALVQAHHGLDPAASRQLDAALVLLLANQVGESAVVFEAIAVARGLAEPVTPSQGGQP